MSNLQNYYGVTVDSAQLASTVKPQVARRDRAYRIAMPFYRGINPNANMARWFLRAASDLRTGTLTLTNKTLTAPSFTGNVSSSGTILANGLALNSSGSFTAPTPLYLYNTGGTNFLIYCATTKTSGGATALFYGPVVSGQCTRFRQQSQTNEGWLWENSNDAIMMAINSTSGNCQIKGTLVTEGSVNSSSINGMCISRNVHGNMGNRRLDRMLQRENDRVLILESGCMVSDQLYSTNVYGGVTITVTPATALTGAELTLATLIPDVTLGTVPTSIISMSALGVEISPDAIINGVSFNDWYDLINTNITGINAALAAQGVVDGIQAAITAGEGIAKMWPQFQGYAPLPDYAIPDEFMQGMDAADMSYSMAGGMANMAPAGSFTNALGTLVERAVSMFSVTGNMSVSGASSFGESVAPLTGLGMRAIDTDVDTNPLLATFGPSSAPVVSVYYDGSISAYQTSVSTASAIDSDVLNLAVGNVNGVPTGTLLQRPQMRRTFFPKVRVKPFLARIAKRVVARTKPAVTRGIDRILNSLATRISESNRRVKPSLARDCGRMLTSLSNRISAGARIVKPAVARNIDRVVSALSTRISANSRRTKPVLGRDCGRNLNSLSTRISAIDTTATGYAAMRKIKPQAMRSLNRVVMSLKSQVDAIVTGTSSIANAILTGVVQGDTAAISTGTGVASTWVKLGYFGQRFTGTVSVTGAGSSRHCCLLIHINYCLSNQGTGIYRSVIVDHSGSYNSNTVFGDIQLTNISTYTANHELYVYVQTAVPVYVYVNARSHGHASAAQAFVMDLQNNGTTAPGGTVFTSVAGHNVFSNTVIGGPIAATSVASSGAITGASVAVTGDVSAATLSLTTDINCRYVFCDACVNTRASEVIPLLLDSVVTGVTSGANQFEPLFSMYMINSYVTISFMGNGRINTGSGADSTGCRPYLVKAGVYTTTTTSFTKLPRAIGDDPGYAANFCCMAKFAVSAGSTYTVGIEVNAASSDDNYTITVNGGTAYFMST
ncbi:hypothetical protein JKP88DRAFT_274695 [Tribonema minus]|uniref:Uncharacterized protein n=1 Tax=Tribonema minus TaxID=303371 RepID=A0A835ZPW2_9STRA|nr:hypothetical protein JKP88DRAFT_274695 [Tribonema minus]